MKYHRRHELYIPNCTSYTSIIENVKHLEKMLGLDIRPKGKHTVKYFKELEDA